MAEIANSISCSMEKIGGAVAKLYNSAYFFKKIGCTKTSNAFAQPLIVPLRR